MIKLKSFFRRGQGGSPSSQQNSNSNAGSSKHSNNLKTSASASSLDRIAGNNADVIPGGSAGTSRKLSKGKHSSKDRLNELLKSSSKEKLIDEKKELKKQKKQMQQMPVVQHQQISQPQINNNVPPVVGPSKQSHELQPQPQPRTVSKDYDIAFDGSKEVSFVIAFFFVNFAGGLLCRPDQITIF
jgi:hypothetical protein